MITRPKLLGSVGSVTDILQTVKDMGQYMSTLATGLAPFTGTRTVGWTDANQFADTASRAMTATSTAELNPTQLATMASELPAKAKALIASTQGNPLIQRYLKLIDDEVPQMGNDIDKIRHTVWLYLMGNLEYMEISGNTTQISAAVTAKVQSCLNALVTTYLTSKGWIKSSSLFSSINPFVALAGLALGFGILRGSKHTKVGA